MIRVKARLEALTAFLARTSRGPREELTLPSTEKTLHLLTQYSVSWISLTGRFLGDCRTACSFTRRAAATYGISANERSNPAFSCR